MAGLLEVPAPPTSYIVAALFIAAVFLSPVKMNWVPGEATICSSSGSGSSGTVARSRSPKEICQIRTKLRLSVCLRGLLHMSWSRFEGATAPVFTEKVLKKVPPPRLFGRDPPNELERERSPAKQALNA